MTNKNKYTGIILVVLTIVLFSGCSDKDSPNPEITAINPTAGPMGTMVTIEGSGFGTSTREVVVTFNETEADISSVEDNQIKTIVPEDATTGAVSIMINGVTVSGPAFTVEPSMPGIASVQPDSGIVGADVVITGQNFSPVPAENSITFNETPAEVESATETELVTRVPEDATDGPIEVTVDDQTAAYTDFDVITTGTLEVEISTTGTDIDIDGYRLSVLTEGAADIDTSVAVNDTIMLRVEAGIPSIELKDIASNCEVVGPVSNPRGVRLAAGDTSKVIFTVECQNQIVELDIVPETISAGDNYSCGLDMDGNAYCWGLNNYGQLGEGTTSTQKTPNAVEMPPNVSFTTISAGAEHTVAISSAGQAYAWGRNNYGQIGDGSIGTEVKRYTPVAVTMPAGVSFMQISAGVNFTVAFDNSGKAYSWGRNSGRLGNGTNDLYSTTPVEVIMPPNVEFVEISAASEGGHTVALSSNGKAWAWGNNQYGMLGDGTTNSSNKPVAVTMPEGVLFKSVDAYYQHTVALSTSGKIWTWGENSRGKLGNGTEGTGTESSIPVPVTMPGGVTFSAIDAGWTHNIALSTEGDAWGWGGNFYGMVGDGTETDRLIPVAINMPAGISFSKISAGNHHTLAVTDNGDAWSWGRNDYAGTLGDGTMTNSAIPIAVDMSFGVFQTE